MLSLMNMYKLYQKNPVSSLKIVSLLDMLY